MNNIFRWVGLVIVVGFAGSFAEAAPKWQRLDADDFTLYSDASVRDVKEFGVRYAAFRQVLSTLFIPAGRKPAHSILILFKKNSSLKKYGPVSTDDEFEILTFTAPVDDAALLALAVSGDKDRASQIAFEFETVFALGRSGRFLPTWMTQGTGMVLSALEVGKGKCVIGAEIEGYSDLFREKEQHLPWAEFFQTGRSSDEYLGKKRAGVFHAQAWALMHWVLFSQRHPREAFETLAANIQRESFLEAVQDTMGVKADQFTTLITGEIGDRKMRIELPFDAKEVESRLRLSPAPEAEVHVQLANMLAAADRFDEAARELDQAIALAPNLTCVKEAAARQALRNQQKDEALNLYREAIAAGSVNPMAYRFSADARLNEYCLGRTDFAGGGGPSTEVAIGELKKALEINPGDMVAYRLLGRAFYILPKFAEDRLADLDPAMISGEDGCGVRYYRALLYQRLGKLDQCAADLRLIIADPEVPSGTKQSVQARLAAIEKRK